MQFKLGHGNFPAEIKKILRPYYNALFRFQNSCHYAFYRILAFSGRINPYRTPVRRNLFCMYNFKVMLLKQVLEAVEGIIPKMLVINRVILKRLNQRLKIM